MVRESNRLITFEQSLPELAGKKHALSFRSATQADEDLINSYIPEPDPVTGEIDPSQLPNTLPGYLIGLIAEFTQDGKAIYSAAAGTMGGELYETLALWSPAFGWDQAVNHPIAGEYRAIGLDLQGANPVEAASLESRMGNIRDRVESGDSLQLAALTKDEVIGDLLFSNIYSYLAVNSMQDELQAQATGIVNYRLPSYGLFGTSLQTSYFFGFPRNVSFAGLVMDVDRLAIQSVSKDNDKDSGVDYVKSIGLRSSAMEHFIPETMMSAVGIDVEGVTAVKALQIANAKGQRIWTITQENLSEGLSAINLGSDIENEIRNAVLAGKVATAHEQPINFLGNSNVGYILVDPETGAGAYLIAGGLNGAQLLLTVLGGVLFLMGIVFSGGIAATTIPIFAAAYLLMGLLSAILSVSLSASLAQSATMAGIFLAIALLPFAAAGGAFALLAGVVGVIFAILSGLPF